MKKKFKKNRLKIFIALSLMITTIFSIMFATNTFAYDTNNELGYTDTLSSITNGNFSSLEYKTLTNNDNQTKNYIELHRTTSANYFNYKVSSEYLETNNYFSDYALLINFDYGWYSGGEWRTYNNGPSVNIIFTNSFSTYNSNYYQYLGAHTLYNEDFNYNYRTTIITNGQTNTTLFNENSDMSFSITNQNSTSYYLRIYNIDFIKQDKVTLSTYYNDLQQQYNQLLVDYNNLELDYTELDNQYNSLAYNYELLDSAYNELEDNYTQLESNYNDLQQEYNELNNYSSDGILSFMRGAYVNNYMANGELDEGQYLNLDNLINLNATNQNTFNVLNASIYSLSHNNRTLSIYFGYNTHTFLYSKVPSNILDLSINTNLTSYLDKPYITIILSNYENGSINTIKRPTINLVLSPQQLASINYNITEENLISLFSYDYQYYNNFDYIRFEFASIPYGQTGYENQYYTFTSTNAETDQSYLIGYNNGVNAEKANSWEREKELSNQVDRLQMEIRTLNQINNSLNEQIEANINDYNLNTLMWTIGSVPFESFKQIWNVNFFGVNLADFFLGFVTFFIALFVVKKFFL